MSMTCKQCRNICDCEDDAWCKGVDFDPDVSVKYCAAFVPETNADRIRAMSDVELAEFLCGVYDDDNCGVYQAESGKFINGITILDYDEFKILEWLLQPAEVDNG